MTDADGPEPGLVAGRYRLVERLGRGSMGEVWRAHDERLDRVVAIKRLIGSAVAVQDDLREARIAARLHHPNAVTVHDVVEHDGTPCIVMEYVDGAPLTGVGTLSPMAVARIGQQLAEALAAAHEVGIVHRDVKPDNVLLAADGTAMLTDFGIAGVVDDVSPTGPGVIVGTPAYLAPEVAAGGAAGFASDVFSLGATLYAAVEGRAPFGYTDDTKAMLGKVATGAVPEPTRAGPLGPTLMWLLRKEPGARPTMPDAARALAAVADGRAMLPPSATRLLAAPRERRPSGRTVAITLASVGLVTLGLIVGIAIGADHQSHSAVAQPPTAATRQVPVPHTQQNTSTACVADYTVTNTWPGGYQAQVTVRAGNVAVNGWTVTLELPGGQTITQLWNGKLSRQGTSVQVGNLSYNATMAADTTTTFGFLGSVGADAPAVPAVQCTAHE